ncbi:MAG: hypothetical protein Q9172_003643 [Xanthocarpia lactea]
MSPKPLTLDGRHLEGGGQLLRLAISLSALTHLPLYIFSIRANRAPARKGGSSQAKAAGGLKPAHLAAVEWLARATRAETTGMVKGSRDVEDQGTTTSSSVPLRITINGGTNVSKSPSIEYISQVLIPLLVEKVGIPPIATRVIKRGWSSGRADVGAVQFDLTPLPSGSKLSKFHFTERGAVTKMHVSILASDLSSRNTLRDKVTEKLLARHPDVEILFPVEEVTKNGARLYLLIVAETSHGYRLGRDCLWERKSNASMLETVACTVTRDLEEELRRGGCVDEYMQDQLVVFQALAEGRSAVDSGEDLHATLHTKTARWVAEQSLGLQFDERGTCSGCAFAVGEDFLDRRKTEREVEETAADLESLGIA